MSRRTDGQDRSTEDNVKHRQKPIHKEDNQSNKVSVMFKGEYK